MWWDLLLNIAYSHQPFSTASLLKATNQLTSVFCPISSSGPWWKCEFLSYFKYAFLPYVA